MATLSYLDRIPVSRRIGGYLNWAKSAGVITDAQVNANATVTLLKAALLAAATAAQQPIVKKLNLALDKAVSLGQISETHGVTTVAGLVALTDASTTLKQGYLD